MGERRVKEHCIQRGLAWDDSLASTSCQEQEYYEDLLRFYRYNHRVSIGFARQGPLLPRICMHQGREGEYRCRAQLLSWKHRAIVAAMHRLGWQWDC